MRSVMFSGRATLFKRSDAGWTSQRLEDVYIGTEKKEIDRGNERMYVNGNVLIVPRRIDISPGDIVLPRVEYPSAVPTDGDNGNRIIKAGGWRVKTVCPNVYPGCTVNHVYVSDV